VRALALLGLLLCSVAPRAQIANTRHNLSVSAPAGGVTSAEPQICIFCHAPHNATPATALWNRRTPGLNYQPYTSSTAKGNAGQPTGASLMCLSCHDGTIALGEVLTRVKAIATTPSNMPAGVDNLGTDLRDDHPVSIAYAPLAAAAGSELAPAASLIGKVKLDPSGQMQCTSCHDPHDNSNGKFLVMANAASALCMTCHAKNYWAQSSHSTSTKTWNGVAPSPWPHSTGTTVAANACENCHRPHTAGGAQRLLNYPAEEDNCYPCHNGHVATKDIKTEFTKVYKHPVASNTGVHDPLESAVIKTRHVECADCHNPHATKTTSGTPDGSMTGVRGVDINGAEINPVVTEYQVCLRCHGDSPGQPSPPTARVFPQTNIRSSIQTGAASHHAVAGPGRNTTMASGLLNVTGLGQLTASSTIKCSDCHNNDAGPAAAPTAGAGPIGPHGSKQRVLLAGAYPTTSGTMNPTNYPLCAKCHSITGTTSILKTGHGHTVHGSNHTSYSCNTCHDPHGVALTGQATAATAGGLINFDTSIVTAATSGGKAVAGTPRIAITATGGACYLTCHGQNHNSESYKN
jgi:predicted CXXCH cytochrome family protein